jgi:DNA ligase-associated metallophosphoesterase
MKIQVANQDIELLPEKALIWHEEHLLALSDVHLGKADSYQAAGVPVPSGSHREDLELISQLIHKYQIKKVVILGDWIHNRHSLSEIVLRDLHEFFTVLKEVHWTLLLGNHEKGVHDLMHDLPFHLVEEEIQMGPFLMTHGHKNPNSELFQIRGHIHPQVRVSTGPLSLRMPCFVLEKNSLTIPAFGSLTGGFIVKRQASNRIFAIGGKEIFEVKGKDF